LATLAQPVRLSYTWDDLVLPAPTTARLRELASALAARDKVFDEWGFRRLSGGYSSVRVLFSGASGTGKTMSAAVIAREVGLELFQVDVSAVVSKYIGDTEKNLERIFRAAEGSDVLLLFDEADALFGKRSEVADAHDRYANIEASYLLQRVERYDGVLILATNLTANLDEAFSRRLHGEIEFPLPDERAREQLWRKAFPPPAPIGDDVKPALLAAQFQLSGGDIRNVALAAAFLAAHERAPIGLAHVMRALARQRHRQGKLPTLAEFGQYLHLVRAE
jgi:SpoVK/Ycf46/Vps4 family AAA+-type ATPase